MKKLMVKFNSPEKSVHAKSSPCSSPALGSPGSCWLQGMVLAGQVGDGALSASYFLNIWEFLEGRLLHLTIALRRKHQTRASRDFFSPLLALMAPLEHP